MASDARTAYHRKNRQKVCCLCLNEHGLKPSRLCSVKEEEIIQSRIAHSFTLKDEKYAEGLCSTCHTQIWRLHHGSSNLIFISKSFGEALDQSPVTRSSSAEKCDCVICCRAQLNGGAWNKFKKEQKLKRKGSSDVNATTKEDHRLCPNCLSQVYLLIFSRNSNLRNSSVSPSICLSVILSSICLNTSIFPL